MIYCDLKSMKSELDFPNNTFFSTFSTFSTFTKSGAKHQHFFTNISQLFPLFVKVLVFFAPLFVKVELYSNFELCFIEFFVCVIFFMYFLYFMYDFILSLLIYFLNDFNVNNFIEFCLSIFCL